MDEPKSSMHFEYPDKEKNVPGWEGQVPLKLEEFSDQIDTRGGYLHTVATKVSDFDQELSRARVQEKELRTAVLNHSQAPRLEALLYKHFCSIGPSVP